MTEKQFYFAIYLCVYSHVWVHMFLKQSHYIDQTGLELRDLPASATGVLGLNVHATTPSSTVCTETLT